MNIVNVGYRSTNYYAIDIKGGKLLVDCGWPGTMPQFIAELRRKGIGPGDIRYVLATHFHPDHAGLVEEFKQRGAKLILLENQRGALKRDDIAKYSGMAPFITVSQENNMLIQCAESRTFLASNGLAGEIIATPGHSDDSVTLILDDGSAFTGDLTPRFAVSEDDELTLTSWDTIYRHKISRIYPAHGNSNLEMKNQ